MMRKCSIIIICLLAHVPAVQADDKEKTLFAAAPPTQTRWQQMNTGMLPRDYNRSADSNRQIVQQRLATYSRQVLTRTGMYAPALSALGAAVSLAATDTRVSLNDSKTMGLLFKDSTSNDRSLMLEFKKSW